MRDIFNVAIRFTLVTALLLGVGYPLTVTAFAHMTMPYQADGQLIVRNGQVIGSAILAQAFTGDRYFHARPSFAGNGYDATSSGGSNYAPSNRKLVDRIDADAAAYRRQNGDAQVPIDLVTASGSGLDPDITPAAALFQVPTVARARGLSEDALRRIVLAHITPRQFGILGEPRVNVLELNLDLDQPQR